MGGGKKQSHKFTIKQVHLWAIVGKTLSLTSQQPLKPGKKQ